jgi:hypothetical protein
MSRVTIRPGLGFPARFQGLLDQRGVTYVAIEAGCGVNARTVGRWVLRRNLPERGKLVTVLQYLQLSQEQVKTLLGGPEEPRLVLLAEEARLLGHVDTYLHALLPQLVHLNRPQLNALSDLVTRFQRALRDARGAAPSLRRSTTKPP